MVGVVGVVGWWSQVVQNLISIVHERVCNKIRFPTTSGGIRVGGQDQHGLLTVEVTGSFS